MLLRLLIRTALGMVFFAVAAGLSQPIAAEVSADDYASVVLQARVLDRQGQPVTELPVRLTADLHGVALLDDGQAEGIMTGETRKVRTNASGWAILPVSGLPWTHEKRWFRGQITLTVSLAADSKREISPLGANEATERLDFPNSGPQSDPLTLSIYEEPGRTLDGFPMWPAANGRLDHMVVCLEGFDLYNKISATDLMQLVSPATDVLRANGVSILVVHSKPPSRKPSASAGGGAAGL